MIQQMYTIKEAAKELGVEAHALRYWEEELNLSIERNAQGRRVYTEEDMQTFKDIMAWKEQGLQLKSIKEMLHGKAIDKELSGSRDELAGHRIIVYRPKEMNGLEDAASMEKEEKARRLQELLKQFISESIWVGMSCQRSPPSTTLSTWKPRQMARMGLPFSRKALQSSNS